MAKINISLPDDMLAQVDALAEELEESRSGLVREATARYLAGVKEQRAREERSASIDRAIATAREVGRTVSDFDSTAAIRADRDRDGRKVGEQ